MITFLSIVKKCLVLNKLSLFFRIKFSISNFQFLFYSLWVQLRGRDSFVSESVEGQCKFPAIAKAPMFTAVKLLRCWEGWWFGGGSGAEAREKLRGWSGTLGGKRRAAERGWTIRFYVEALCSFKFACMTVPSTASLCTLLICVWGTRVRGTHVL